MKAVICTQYGPPEVLKIREVPTPVPKKDELLINIKATAVNSGDVRVRALDVYGFMKLVMRFVLGFTKPRKPILGTVFSGVVESTGDKVTKFKISDSVFGMTGFKFGAYAEYISVNENSTVCLMPKNASYEEAAALIFGGQTAIYFLEKANIKELNNPQVLIYGATGSVGVAAIQLANYYNADVTAVCSTKGEALVKSLGVQKVVLYDTMDFTSIDQTFDIVFDAVGKTTKKQCKKLLKPKGVFKSVLGFDVATESISQLQLLKEMFETQRYKAVIDQVYPFEKIVEAHHYVDAGKKKGNVVLKLT